MNLSYKQPIYLLTILNPRYESTWCKRSKVGDLVKKIIWINGNYKEDNRIFDSKIQAKEWADSLLPEFGPYLISQVNVGYETPDEDVINYLEYFLPKWATYNNAKISIHREKTIRDGQDLYIICTQQI